MAVFLVFLRSYMVRPAVGILLIGGMLSQWVWGQGPVGADAITVTEPNEQAADVVGIVGDAGERASLQPENAHPSGNPVTLLERPPADTYFDVEYLLWGLDGVRIPRILTSNPVGTPLANVANVNDPSTQTLIGGDDEGGQAQSGMRFRLGHVPEGDRLLSRWELSGWFLFEQGDEWSATSVNGDPILARPFFNTVTGQPDAQLVGYPGIASGTFNAKYNQRMFGVDPLIFTCLSGNSCQSWEGVAGYQYMRIEDEFRVTEQVTPVANPLIAPGTTFLVQDEFRTTNDYHLFPLGLNFVRRTDFWRFGFRGLVGLGFVSQSARIRGETTVTADSGIVSTTPGGFLALESNMGSEERTRFAWSPQLNFNVRRNLRSGLWLQAGYTMMYVSDVARSLRYVNANIDPNQLPPAVASGADPGFVFISSGELIHGLNAGLQWNF